ncbi:MAG: hypothetical protein JW966_00235 [Anaerolineae bacterium]|nr:hypothetical protein [Anaerolineae bacterium]
MIRPDRSLLSNLRSQAMIKTRVEMPQETYCFMATNASTWFYSEPEHRAFLLEERVNHTFWSNRIGGLYLDCTSETPPFKMTGEWHGEPVGIDWIPNNYFRLTTTPGKNADLLIVGIKEILGFVPTISYVDRDGQISAEWYVKQAEQRIQDIQGNPNYRDIKRYKR